ncbi:uncharacterized protein LOC121381408 [Gigantopelta aegis]|uniref:uncharacterized protein LOC121381408 n=1 Tax=Gigantopelta aegis TaxID=1735272 RepID=UPI001B887EF3|nr:uncharacterized protein LOC121381408 [Gigantopelta aegis]
MSCCRIPKINITMTNTSESSYGVSFKRNLAQQQSFSEFSVQNVWTKLRQAHSKALLRQKKLPSGTGTSNRTSWKHIDAMPFLIPTKVPRNTASNCSDDDEGGYNDDDGIENQNEDESQDGETASQADNNLDEIFPELIKPPAKRVNKSITNPKKHSRHDRADDTAISISEAAKSITQ